MNRGFAISIMESITPNQIVPFFRRFRFKGGSLRLFRVRNNTPREAGGTVVVSLMDTESNEPVRLRLRMGGVEEYRFQRRPGPGLVRLKEVRIGYFNGLMYLNLDAYADEGPLAVHDFRASDAFIAGRSLSWEIVPARAKSDS